MGIGENIRKHRTARRLSQEHLADLLGVTRQAVSKWETGLSEPSSRNLSELAVLFEIPVSELVEPEEPQLNTKGNEQQILKRNLEITAVGAYTGFATMTTIRTSDPGFYVYACFLTMAAGIWMAFNISRLPGEIRLKAALKELGYCIVIWATVRFLPGFIGGIFTSILAIVLCVLYAGYIRFPHYRKKRN